MTVAKLHQVKAILHVTNTTDYHSAGRIPNILNLPYTKKPDYPIMRMLRYFY